jgi:hypothetical protein
MKDERNNMDKLFSEGLGDFSPAPPPELWERIETSLPAPVPDTPAIPVSGSARLITIGIAAALLTGLAVLWFLNGKDTGSEKKETIIQNITPANEIINMSNAHETKEDKSGSSVSSGTIKARQNSKPPVNNHEAGSQTKSSPTNTLNEITDRLTAEQKMRMPGVQVAKTIAPDPVFKAEAEEESAPIADLRRDFTSWLNSQAVAFRPASAASAFSSQYKSSHRPAIPRGDGIPLIGGVYASIDMIDYGRGHKKQSRSAGISLSTFKGPWTIETGAAICLSDDNGRYMINYNSYDSLGFYNKVVSFSPQPNGTIQFITEVEGVYDSIDHQLETNTTNRYTYLQIPLMAGYQLYSNRLLTISLKAGPVFSVMMDSYEPQANFSREGTNLQSIENLSPSRLSANWQVAAGLGVGFYLSRRFTLLAEPTYKTYLRPVYQNQRTRPQSFGIKAGLLYRF